MRDLQRVAVALVALMLTLAACAHPAPQPSGPRPVSDSDGGGVESDEDRVQSPRDTFGESAAQNLPTDPAEDPAYERYYSQRVQWGPCEEVEDEFEVGLECGSVNVPKKWNDPDAGDISIALARVAAGGDKQGSLFMNPGGPGASGVDFLGGAAAFTVSSSVADSYDLVSFDPRGVSRSAGITCMSDEEYGAAYDEPGDPDATAEEALEEGLAFNERMAQSCKDTDGDLLPYLDTYSAARDLDVLRAAVDSQRLDYLGYSYGSYLGVTYADLYPQRVGKFVLDSVIDPSLTYEEFAEQQTASFEAALEAFLANCLERGETCLFEGSVDEAKQQLEDLLADLDREPVSTNDPTGRKLTGSHATSAVIFGLYLDEMWSVVQQGLADAAGGEGSLLLTAADLAAERKEDGSFNGNGAFAISAINCLDHTGTTDEQHQKELSAQLAEKYPFMGQNAGYAEKFCEAWAKPVREPAPISATGAGPIVVIGTTGDPATPYPWAQSLVDQLDSAVLLTFEANGHTAYGRSGGCIEEAVDAYLVDGTVPDDGLTCS